MSKWQNPPLIRVILSNRTQKSGNDADQYKYVNKHHEDHWREKGRYVHIGIKLFN